MNLRATTQSLEELDRVLRGVHKPSLPMRAWISDVFRHVGLVTYDSNQLPLSGNPDARRERHDVPGFAACGSAVPGRVLGSTGGNLAPHTLVVR